MIRRDHYLQELIDRMNNGMIKVITGIRRCGKSYLLFNIFNDYLLKQGINHDHIIKIQLDDIANEELCEAQKLYAYIKTRIIDKEKYFILLDEIQMVSNFEMVLNSLLHINNVDIYVTGSNAKFLSMDIITEFRGRGDQIHLSTLSFKEYFDSCGLDFEDAWNEYSTFGGMPFLLMCKNDSQKINYLTNLFNETYIKDIVNRNNIRNTDVLEDTLNIVSSAVGSLTNPNKLSKTFKSMKNIDVAPNTISQYLNYCEDSFLIRKAYRYDVKGKNYIDTPMKYYFSDIGLRNARLGFRQQEESHIMENIIYNELINLGYNVDVGVVTVCEKNENGNYCRKQLEVDFICNFGYERIYIQSALNVDTNEKNVQEEKSLINIDDSFKKVIIVRNNIKKWRDEKGILILGLKEFLTNPESIKS